MIFLKQNPNENENIRILEELVAENESQVQDTGTVPYCIKKKSQRFPLLTLCPKVDLFVKMVTKEFETISTSISNDNLTTEQRSSLNRLKKLNDVVFKSADKGGGGGFGSMAKKAL